MTAQVTALAKWDEQIGRLVLNDQASFHAILRRIKNLQHGEPFEIKATRILGRRTSAANRAYWGWIVRPIALSSGQSLDEIHRCLKAEYLPTERLVIADKQTGEVKFERELEHGSTTRMTEAEFQIYMESCRVFGATHCGIDFSPAGLWAQFGIGEG